MHASGDKTGMEEEGGAARAWEGVGMGTGSRGRVTIGDGMGMGIERDGMAGWEDGRMDTDSSRRETAPTAPGCVDGSSSSLICAYDGLSHLAFCAFVHPLSLSRRERFREVLLASQARAGADGERLRWICGYHHRHSLSQTPSGGEWQGLRGRKDSS